MLMGLYGEVEGGRPDWSTRPVGIDHPEWFLYPNVLNLTNPGVAAYVESELERIVADCESVTYAPQSTADVTIAASLSQQAIQLIQNLE